MGNLVPVSVRLRMMMGSCSPNHPADLVHHLAGGKPVGQCRDGQKDSSTYQVPGLASPDKYQDKYRVEANLGQEKFRSDDSNGGDKGMFGLEDKNSKQKRHRTRFTPGQLNELERSFG